MGKKAPAVPGYSLGDVLGEGTLASTRLGRPDDESRDLVAVKTVRKDHPRFQEEGLRREVAILERLKHPRVVKLVELVEDDEAFHLVEELGAGGEMFERILELGSFCEADAVHLIHQIVQGATYLHSQGVVHRDLKPENILMMGSTPNTDEYMRIKICDFGLSAMRRAEAEDGWAGTGMQIIAGTQSYMAPEIFLLGTMADQADGHDTMSSLDENQDMRVALARDAFQRALDQNEAIAHDGKVCMKPTYGEHCTAAVDIWAIGVIFFVMLRGEFPFEEDDHQIVKICSGQFEMNSGWDAISQQSQLFTRRCLCSNYKTRPTGPQLLEDVLFLNDALPRDNLDHVPLLRRHAATKHDHVAGKSVRSAIRLQNLGAKSAVNVIRDAQADEEALRLFHSIDAMGDGNGEVELFEIVLYVQEKAQHLFHERDVVTGEFCVDEDRLHAFATMLKTEVDLDKDGKISETEFVRAYSKWAMHWQRAVSTHKLAVETSAVYTQ